MLTPHNEAKKGDIAETVIMPGDPLRAKFMAENFLEDAHLFNSVRNMLGYTGTYKGKRVSVMGSGMGMPSMALYSYELFHFYDVKQIIRTGTVGAIQKQLEIGDLVIAQAACTDSSYMNQFHLPGNFSPIADYDLLSRAVDECRRQQYTYHVGNVASSDVFYTDTDEWKQWMKMGVLALEMETAALYANAARAGRKALAIMTVTDHMLHQVAVTHEQRETSLTNMMDVAFSLI